MTVHLRTDSDGTVFQVWAQRQAMSCAIASMWMTVGMVRQQTLMDTEWDLAQRVFQHAVQGVEWAATDPGEGGRTIHPAAVANNRASVDNMFGRAGTLRAQTKTALEAQGVTVQWQQANGNYPCTLVPARLGVGKPALTSVGWWRRVGGNWQRRGGHAMVVARQASNGRLVWLDPAGGRLREFPNNGRYGNTGWVESIMYCS